MKIPLMAYPGDQFLTVIANGKRSKVPFPFKPFVYVQRKLGEHTHGNLQYKTYTDLWKKTEIELAKLEFNTPRDSYSFYNDYNTSKLCYYLPYMEQIMVEEPEFFTKFPQTKEPVIMTLDIETWNDGTGVFPHYSTHPITAIGVKINDAPTKVYDNYDNIYKDKYILEEFMRDFIDIDCDIIVTYNGVFFDLPYMIKRMEKTKLTTMRGIPLANMFCRPPSLPLLIEDKKDKKKHSSYNIYGRIMMDIYENVRKDQNNFGMKNRKLKTVAEWYNIPISKHNELYTENSKKYIKTDILREHVTSDVEATYRLMKIYLPLQILLADFMKVPLNNIISGKASFIPKLFIGRGAHKSKMIPMETNADRYGDTKFQAAMVGLNKPGYYKEIYKVDITSFYPSIMRTFNLGPDTTIIYDRQPFEQDIIPKFSINGAGDFIYVGIPDENFKEKIMIKIDKKNESFLKERVDKLFAIRKECKEKIKTSKMDGEKQYNKIHSTALKIILNSLFGLNGLKYSRLGDMSVAIAIVGIARWIFNEIIEYYGSDVVNWDTDGIIVSKKPDLDKLNKYVTDLVESNAHVKNHIHFELELSGKGYFYKPKNYAIMQDNSKLEMHGVSMKSSRAAGIYDEAIKRMCDVIFAHDNDPEKVKMVINGVRNLNNYDINDFVMRTSINKSEYKNPNALQPSLIRKSEEVLKKKLKVGDSIEYFRTWDKYAVKEEVKSIDNLDKHYYSEVIEKALRIFDHGVFVEKEKAKKEAIRRDKEDQLRLEL